MELREFAETVLHGRRLAEKLVHADTFTDRNPGAPSPLQLPGRPPELEFATTGRDELPAAQALADPVAAGRLLHRFANHELLALEIMASTLLRFPDAPAAFRAGLGRTMQEEQRHLAAYLRRMAALGVTPGEVPVNDFFWRATASNTGPLDYVIRVALTFEQANLDFTRTWRARFAAVGDAETAAMLDEVYADEIGHIRGGLACFRQWKDPALTEWEAFERGLPMPLSPARARGQEVDRAGRLAAGVTEDWVDRIELFTRSRGRPPRVFLFNPDAEAEVARGRPGHQPDRAAAQLAADLAPTLAILAAREDAVITPRIPSPAWQRALVAAGFPLPEFVPTAATLADRLVGELRPWGATPDAAVRLRPLVGADTLWSPTLRDASSKLVALSWRAELLAALDDPELVPAEGEACLSLEQAEAAGARGWLLKAPFSTAGRSRRRGPLDAGGRAWAARVLTEQGGLRAEPWRERQLDFSFHFDVDPDGSARFIGICRFGTTPAGQFTGTRPGRWFGELEPALARFLSRDGRAPRRLRELGERVAAFLSPRLAALGVRGAVGVDAFVYREGDSLRLDPLVEVNPRLTMGRVSLAMDPRIHPLSRARWEMLPVAGLGASAADWFAARLAETPLDVERGLIRRGVLATNDPATAERVLGVLTVVSAP